MAYSVSFGTIHKKINSTSQTYTVTFTATCNLKEPCDTYNPVFTIQGAFPETANYMFVSEWGKYYWITGVSFVLGHWEVTGKCDVLATYKADIGAQSFYVVRTYSVGPSHIPDPYAVTITGPEIQNYADTIGLDGTGTYVICCAGAAGNKFYMMREADWQTLYASVYSSAFLTDYKNIWDAIVQEVSNTVLKPEDYIVYAKWLPVPPSGTAVGSVSLGFTNVAMNNAFAVAPSTLLITHDTNYPIPSHPQAAQFGPFLNGSQYRRISVKLPGYGNIIIDPDIAQTAPFLQITAQMDITGVLTYVLRLSSVGPRLAWETQVCTDLSTDAGFSTSRSSITNAVAAIGGTVAGMAAGAPLAGIIAGAGSIATSMMPQVERASAGGSRAAVSAGTAIVITVENFLIRPADRETHGCPYCMYQQISALPGYNKCADASIECSGTQVEIEEINSFLNGGFYYE